MQRHGIVTNLSKMESAYLYMLMAISMGSVTSTMILRNELLGTPRYLGVKIAHVLDEDWLTYRFLPGDSLGPVRYIWTPVEVEGDVKDHFSCSCWRNR
jgi:hypothetical protein